MNKPLIIAAIALMSSCSSKEQKNIEVKEYPQSKKVDHVDNYFGTTVADPYRWLENDTSAETGQWVDAQNAVTQDYLSQIPFRTAVKDRLTEIWNFEKLSAPFQKGNFLYYYKNDGLQNQSVLYRKENGTEDEKVFIDPNSFSKDGTVSLGGVYFSKDYKYAAYTVNISGSDWTEIYVLDVATGKKLADKLEWVKFSGASWNADGFYYSRYDKPSKGSTLSGQNEFQKIYYHKLGQTQDQDILVYEDKMHPLRYFGAEVSDDQRWLIITESEGTSGVQILVKDLKNPSSKPSLLLAGFKNNYSFVDVKGEKLLFLMDKGADKYRLVAIDPNKPEENAWEEIIAEQDALLEGVYPVGGYLFALQLKNVQSQVSQYSYDGKLIREIMLPGIGTANLNSGSAKDKQLYYSFSNFSTPGTAYSLNVADGSSTLLYQPKLKVNTDNLVTEQLWFKSKDGTKVPMFIVHKKDIKLDGNNPVLLYGYGGFNISLTPSFSVSNLFFLEQGGIYAQVSLRGGGEFGEEWHKAGMLEKKQNVFDDFISAAEYLISEKYTNSNKLAISGRSNGGLLVGACMTQRPDLFKVAMPGVGVLDMLRYHKFTIGWGWAVEYGSSDQKKDFDYLYKYSPLHNVKAGKQYPATMVITADHDDRVVPAHSFKFAAELQSKQSGSNPVLIRIDKNAGHGAGKPTSKLIDDATDFWSFVMWNLGMNM